MIKATARALMDLEEEAFITLANFGVGTEWSFSRGPNRYDQFQYAMIEADDESLRELHDYVVGESVAAVEVAETESPWTSSPMRLFISHRTVDAAWASELRTALAFYGISAFVAHKDITPTLPWRAVIKTGLRSCHMMVAIAHPTFHQSQWCDQEVGWALGRGIPVATIRRGDADDRQQDGFMEELQDITLEPARANAVEYAARLIFATAISSISDGQLIGQMLAEALVSSRSFDQTRALWAFIAAHSTWNRASVQRLRYAVTTNNQVFSANVGDQAVSDLIDALAGRHDPIVAANNFADDAPF